MRSEITIGGPRKPDWFDVNEFISILPHIKVQEGYTIDYVQFQGQNGSPMLYARKNGQYPYSSFNDFQKERLQKIDEIFSTSRPLEEIEKAYRKYDYQYMNFIQADGSAESFMEFVLFRIMGNNFYLMWHANYDDDRPVCKFNDLDKAVSDAITQFELNPEKLDQLLEQAHDIDLSPKVEFENEVVKIKMFLFTKFGGLYQYDITMNRTFPHVVIDEQFNPIINYDAGFSY